MTAPRPDPAHELEGVCVCEAYVAGVLNGGLARVGELVPSPVCGLASHRMRAASWPVPDAQPPGAE